MTSCLSFLLYYKPRACLVTTASGHNAEANANFPAVQPFPIRPVVPADVYSACFSYRRLKLKRQDDPTCEYPRDESAEDEADADSGSRAPSVRNHEKLICHRLLGEQRSSEINRGPVLTSQVQAWRFILGYRKMIWLKKNVPRVLQMC